MSEGGFRAGLSARHDAAATALRQAFAARSMGFAPADLLQRIDDAPAPGPRHFSPADSSAKPTQGWDPLDPSPQAAPFADPVAAARAAGYAEGLAAAAATMTSHGERDRMLLAGLIAELGSGNRIDRERIARQLRQTVLLLVTRLVGEVGIAPDILAARVTAATDLLADAAESAILRVHPDDVALLDGRLPQAIFPVGDAGVARGSFVLEAASTLVEDGPGLWLEQLAHAIDHVPVPVLTC